MSNEAQALSAEMPDASTERRSVSRKRLTIEVSPGLHRRIVQICSTRGLPVNQAVRDVLERAFPG